MVIDDLDVLRATRCPYETHPELVVDADAVLAGAVAFQCFQPIARWHLEVAQVPGPVQHGQLSHCHRLDTHEPPDTPAAEQGRSIGTVERPNRHKPILTRYASIVKR